jgi:hypothetical protein
MKAKNTSPSPPRAKRERMRWVKWASALAYYRWPSGHKCAENQTVLITKRGIPESLWLLYIERYAR